MFILHFCLFFLKISQINSIQIPFINNSILIQGYRSNISTRIINGTCSECLCQSSLSSSILNCFPNNTCQLFSKFSSMYRIEGYAGAHLYFPQEIFPNASECCMPDINTLLNKLTTGIITTKTVPQPRDVVIDNYGYLVTVEESQNYLDRFNAINLTDLKHQSIPKSRQMAITYLNNAYYIAPYSVSMTVIDSNNLSVIANINTNASGTRDIIFLNNGQMMVLSSFDDNSLVFYNRTDPSSVQYDFLFRQFCTFQGPHGMWSVNGSFFYVTSYTDKTLYSISATSNLTQWKETLILTTGVSSNGATRMAIDECNRFWFTFETNTILIYDQQGHFLANWTISSPSIFDINIAENYLMYFSDSNNNQIRRIDPRIQCFS